MAALAESYLLTMTEEARKLIEAGEAHRLGGVVYSNAGRIIEHLHDVDIAQNSEIAINGLVGAAAVPIAVFGASLIAINHRLAKIEEKIQQLQDQIKEVLTELHLLNFKADAQLIGKLNGTIHACQVDLSEQRNDRLPVYRQAFIEAYNVMKSFVFAMARKADEFRTHEQVFVEYSRAMFLAGLAARDVSYRMGEEASAIEFSERLSRDAQELKSLVYGIVDTVPALLWRRDEHVDVAIEIRESQERLQSHVDMLKALPGDELQGLLTRQVNV
ncbi:hypothetical protein [Dechloromonas sp. H13]|uniref:hypothetical protein n=1 Tax=Dechloromonas sp. H13 TaxID=2570193 RepID=UPI00129235A7|nr:hypothetical protein [Dechloromonas sp. H13]